MWMATAMPTSLNEGKMIRVLDGLSIFLDGLWEQIRIVWNCYVLWNFRFRTFGHMECMWLPFPQAPLKTRLTSIHIDTFTVLPSHIIQKPPNLSRYIWVLTADMCRLNCPVISTFLRNVLPHRPRTKAADCNSRSPDQTKTWADNMGCIVHWDHLLPIWWPSVHILRMASCDILQLSKLVTILKRFQI